MTSSAQRLAAPGVLDLGIGHPDPRLLPAGLLRDAADRALQDTEGALQYGAERGPERLRDALSGFLLRETGVTTPVDRLMVTSGISQALDLICTVFTKPGDVVLVEEPTYFLARDVFADHGLEVVGVPVDADGVDVELLEAAAWKRRPAFFYSVPFFQNPSGVSLSRARREGLLAVSRKHDLLVVSDEAYQLLAYGGPPPPSLASEEDSVLALGSFSKILAPGLRLGWLHGPTELVRRVAQAGMVVSGGGLNPFGAAVATALLEDRKLDEHVATLRERYRERGEVLLGALRAAASGRWTLADVRGAPSPGAPSPGAPSPGAPSPGAPSPAGWVPGGYFVWLRVPGMDMADALPVFEAAGVAYQPGARFSSRGGLADHARLCFAYYGEERLREAVVRFGRAMEAAGFGA